mmetsp:Transcript_22089/g.39163  ORF Transcript_22089/g.39163 Transcript_22089/m.39163 type:complete len:190 (-) Transcript_22089:122-691(-)
MSKRKFREEDDVRGDFSDEKQVRCKRQKYRSRHFTECKLCDSLRRKLRPLDRKQFMRNLEIDYWKRTEECSKKKKKHMEKIEQDGTVSMEDYVLKTTLKDSDHAMEKNLFPYKTPKNIEHWTLWAMHDMDMREIERFVYDYVTTHMPNVVSWEYDENSHRSIDIFHVHIYLKFRSRSAERELEYDTPPR